jgi:hypothetical protein
MSLEVEWDLVRASWFGVVSSPSGFDLHSVCFASCVMASGSETSRRFFHVSSFSGFVSGNGGRFDGLGVGILAASWSD